MKSPADFGCTFTCRSYGAKWLSDLVSINMTPLTGLESANLSSRKRESDFANSIFLVPSFSMKHSIITDGLSWRRKVYAWSKKSCHDMKNVVYYESGKLNIVHSGYREDGEKPSRPRHCNRGRNPDMPLGSNHGSWEGWKVGRSGSQETCLRDLTGGLRGKVYSYIF